MPWRKDCDRAVLRKRRTKGTGYFFRVFSGVWQKVASLLFSAFSAPATRRSYLKEEGERIGEIQVDVKEAVKKAIAHVAEVFKNENPTNIGLEEVSLNEQDDAWEVTIGFSRPWDYPSSLVQVLRPEHPRRQYKIVKIDNKLGEVTSIKIRAIRDE